MTFQWVKNAELMALLYSLGWRVVAYHPVFQGRSVLMRKDS
jgi:hypothetical protein